MRVAGVIVLVFFCCGAAAGADGDIVSRAPCALPEYGAVGGIGSYSTAAEYAEARDDRRFVCERIVYRSGELDVVACLYRPEATRAGKPPVVVFNRGGYTVPEQAVQLLVMFRRLAREGFLVLAPMYRGRAGASGHDEMGGADLGDLPALLPLLRRLPVADISNLFLYGESRGGVMTRMALRDGFPARAVATFGAITDFGVYLAENPPAAATRLTVWPDYAERSAAILESRSALRWADRVEVPVLIMHGGADKVVNPSHSLRLALRLQEAGRPYSLKVFAGDGHVLPRNRVQRDAVAAQWFRDHLLRPGGETE